MPLNHKNQICVGDIWEKIYYIAPKLPLKVVRLFILEVHSTHSSAVGMFLSNRHKTVLLTEDIIYHGSGWKLVARV